uniref:Threonine synthase n=1 Tax=Paulinella micropora TaxID=1928728 RepID=A0A1L5YBU9_9EUKA|nr:threonine synthase [Paulinella micropora]AQX44950.1 threonine synthase [Paulinella micropora]
MDRRVMPRTIFSPVPISNSLRQHLGNRITSIRQWRGLIEEYHKWLPVSEKTPIITLGEGATPLIPADHISEIIGRDIKVYLKFDGLNPTGSFKDRGMTIAISKAKERGAKTVICASTGNTSASAAAYARRAGIKVFILIPDGYVSQAKLAQALVYGAEVITIKGNFDKALDIVQAAAKTYPVTLVNSLNPYRLQGQKTAAFEVIDVLEKLPDFLCIPVGNAGNISAYWMGFSEYRKAYHGQKLPHMMGFQASLSAPLVFESTVEKPSTLATAIQIGRPVNRDKAVKVKQDSRGIFAMITDAEIIQAYKLLGNTEGVFCEPASAISVAGLLKHRYEVPNGSTVVCVLTGNGLKDPDCAIQNNCAIFHKKLDPDIKEIVNVLGF